MKWLEIIELRSSVGSRELLESQLRNLIHELGKENKTKTIRAYSHVMINTDFTIHLWHNSKKMEYGGSRLGLNLASALKEFGLVNHSVWFEMQDN